MTDDTMHVLDANVFIHGASRRLQDAFTTPVTVPAVTAELESRDAGRRLDVDAIPVYEPAPEYVQRITAQVESLMEDLSETDVQVLALALERDAVVVSDDYGVQNVAASMDIDYEGFLQEEITEQIQWQYRCTNCGETVDEEMESCPTCGGAVEQAPADADDR